MYRLLSLMAISAMIAAAGPYANHTPAVQSVCAAFSESRYADAQAEIAPLRTAALKLFAPEQSFRIIVSPEVQAMKDATSEDVMAVCKHLTTLVKGEKRDDKALAVEAAKLNHALGEFRNRHRKAVDPRGHYERALARARVDETFANWSAAAGQACADQLFKEGLEAYDQMLKLANSPSAISAGLDGALMRYESAAKCALESGEKAAVHKWLLVFVGAASPESRVFPLPPMGVAAELWKGGDRKIVENYLQAAVAKEWRGGKEHVEAWLRSIKAGQWPSEVRPAEPGFQ